MSAPRRIVLATNNAGKVAELAELLSDLPVELELLRDAVGPVDISEPFATFHENAAHKAITAARLAGCWALAEDSGLVVDALGGRPGVYSARFAGKGTPDGDRIDLLLEMLTSVPPNQRGARFRCAIALASPGEILGDWRGTCEGSITTAPRGQSGFGYDPIFQTDGQARTNAELSRAEKNAISHRGMAIRLLMGDLPGMLGG